MKKMLLTIIALTLILIEFSSCRLSPYPRRGYYYPRQRNYDDVNRGHYHPRKYMHYHYPNNI